MTDKPEAEKPPSIKRPTLPKEAGPIAVKRLRFVKETDLGTNNEVAMGITASDGEQVRNTPHFKMTYLPFMRHHVIAVYGAGKDTPVVKYVHESNVLSWEPA